MFSADPGSLVRQSSLAQAQQERQRAHIEAEEWRKYYRAYTSRGISERLIVCCNCIQGARKKAL